MITKTDKALNAIFGTTDDDIEQVELSRPRTELTDIVEATPPVEYRPTPIGEVINDDEIMDAEDDEFKADISRDYQESRENIRDLIYKSGELLDMAMSVAQSTEDPKAIDAAVSVMTKIADLNEKLLRATEQRQKIYNSTRKRQQKKFGNVGGINSNNTQDNSTTTVEQQTNIVFQGTTADLAKMLKNINEEQKQ